MLTVFGALAELEREQILQRQKEGIAIAKSKGCIKAVIEWSMMTLAKYMPNGSKERLLQHRP